MTDERDPLEVAAEVAGTPEQVWEHIATGPGISTWFMPAEVDGRVGGEIAQRHAEGEDGVSRGVIRAWEPPHRLLYEEPVGGDRTMATEFLVEARSGGTCVVRIVTHGLRPEEEDTLGSLVQGWTQALAVLRIRLRDFPAAPASSFRIWTTPPGSLDEAWSATLARLGLADASEGDEIDRTTETAAHPPFAGRVELVQPHALLLRTTTPADGVLSFAAAGFGGATHVVLDRYLYGDAAAAADRAPWEASLRA